MSDDMSSLEIKTPLMPLSDSEPYRLPEPPCWIRRVKIRNYKSIRHAELSLSPFTILVGRNGSGKSNFLDAFHFLSDSLQVSLDYATDSRGGVKSVSRRTNGGKSTSLAIDLEISLPSGSAAEYRFVLMQSRRRFVVFREELHVQTPGQGDGIVNHYVIRGGNVESSSIPSPPPADAERLYLVKASGFSPFREVYDALTVMGFYNFNPEAMRAIQGSGPGDLLRRDGANIASVVRRLKEQQPQEMARLESYLGTIVPDLLDVKVRSFGSSRETLEFRQKMAEDKTVVFDAVNMSDGTLRATGILAAVAQLSGQQKPITLIGIEEPETALHPAAARALMDALREASVQAQILVTTHSPDLLDQVQKDNECLLAVMSQDGVTLIAPLNEASREAIDETLFTPGELLRLGQLDPDLKDLVRQEQSLLSWIEEDNAPIADRSDRRRPR